MKKIKKLIASSLFAMFTTLVYASDAPDFNFEVRPILSRMCFHCHGPDAEEGRKAGLRLDTYAGAIEVRKGKRAIDPEKLMESDFLKRITTKDEDDVMPPIESKRSLTKEQIDILTRWVKHGAKYEEHWAFMPPKKRELPKVKEKKDWGEQAIDAFVYDKLKQKGLRPSSEASKEQLLRRVSFDLTGLPPTLEERKVFLQDKSADAYEKLVDRLLKSEHFGERMALAWMDASRYGDTSVMHADGPRTMWPWRDWVIESYNENKPFDEFTVEQLAGDLIPNATWKQKLATGFNRNHATSDEGGAFPEELRVEYVVDRVKTTSNVWLGLSMECGQCHDHKFDPISQKEYFKFYAYFNNNQDPGMQTRRGNQSPVINIVDEKHERMFKSLREKVNQVKEIKNLRRKQTVKDVANWLKTQEGKFASTKEVLPPKELRPIHRYTFSAIEGATIEDTGFSDSPKTAKIVDLKGSGKVSGKGGYAFQDGKLRLFGGNKNNSDYVGFPKNLLDGLESASFEIWATPYSPKNWSRVFDFGDNNKNYLTVTWSNKKDKGLFSILWQGEQNSTKNIKSKLFYHPAGKEVLITLTIQKNEKGSMVHLYLNAKEVANFQTKNTIKKLGKNNLFLGRSQYPDEAADAAYNEFRVYNRALSKAQVLKSYETGPGKGFLQELLAVPEKDRSQNQKDALASFYLKEQDSIYKSLITEENKLLKQESDLENKRPKLTSMIMADNTKVRKTYILNRGQYDQPIKSEVIEPGVPAFLPALAEGAPKNRLSLARWMVNDKHPLTARVAVNRYWSMFFGKGIVETVMDLGSQSAPPTHPKLLDWLAVDFMEHDWDIKHIVRRLVMSKTYRQSSKLNAKSKEIDPENKWLSRGSRFRLQGEFIRDNALSVSGLLVNKIGGISVRPYQPPGIWNEVTLDKRIFYKKENGDKLYRRSMYTYWRRSAPPPNMTIFDAPSREKCVVQRSSTNTPLQALVTLNDVHFVEASRKLAERVMTEGKTFAERINLAFNLNLSRDAESSEIAICQDVFEKQLASFGSNPAEAKKYITQGDSKANAKLDQIELAAYSVIMNMILNLDEVITRG